MTYTAICSVLNSFNDIDTENSRNTLQLYMFQNVSRAGIVLFLFKDNLCKFYKLDMKITDIPPQLLYG